VLLLLLFIGLFHDRLAEIKLLLPPGVVRVAGNARCDRRSHRLGFLPAASHCLRLKYFLVFDHRTLPLMRLLGPAFLRVALLKLLDFPSHGSVCLFYLFVIQITQKPGMEQRAGKFIQTLSWGLLKLKDMTKCAGMPTPKTCSFFPFWGVLLGSLFKERKGVRTQMQNKICT